MFNKDDKKKCFVVTPIGDNESSIRRHIDGIIDQAIIPALESKYEIDVAHRKYEIGSINDRVMKGIYEADLVVANLTGLNPNVMFELAMRYSFGKPAIIIAEQGTKLPFDINVENTIFYINDPAGANDLKKKLEEFENNIDTSRTDYGPIYKAIRQIPLYQEVESGEKVSDEKLLSYVISRLDSLESSLNSKRKIKDRHNPLPVMVVSFNYEQIEDPAVFQNEIEKVLEPYRDNIGGVRYRANGIIISIRTRYSYSKVMEMEDALYDFFHKSKVSDFSIYQSEDAEMGIIEDGL